MSALKLKKNNIINHYKSSSNLNLKDQDEMDLLVTKLEIDFFQD